MSVFRLCFQCSLTLSLLIQTIADAQKIELFVPNLTSIPLKMNGFLSAYLLEK